MDKVIEAGRDLSGLSTAGNQSTTSVDRTKRLGKPVWRGPGRCASTPSSPAWTGTRCYARRHKGLIVPRLRHAADASNFDEYPDDGGEGERLAGRVHGRDEGGVVGGDVSGGLRQGAQGVWNEMGCWMDLFVCI